MKYLFLVSRFSSFIIDYIIFFILYYYTARFGTAGYILLLAAFFLYRVLTSACLGATLGMMALKLKLQKHDFGTCLKREILRFASAFFYVGYIYALFDSKNRTLHDAASDTLVVYGSSNEKMPGTHGYVKIIASVLLIISSLRWVSSFILNDIGLLGLKKVYTSDEYFQSFNGDKLLSLSQDELYMKTLGRKYLAVIDINNKPYLVRISNKLTHTEVYRFNIENDRLSGEYLYKIDMPLQFICSGKFESKKDLCGISPDGEIIIADEKGYVYGKNKVSLSNILALKCGDIDGDSFDEAAVLGRGGDVEIFKMDGNALSKIYSGKIGEDIIPVTFYIDSGIVVMGKGDNKSILHFYRFVNKKFQYKDKKYFNIDNAADIKNIDNNILVSYISRNNMTFARGKIQRLEVYSIDGKIKRLYNFGSRPGRRYAYLVRSLEDIYDIDGDGNKEIILKAAGKNDVMGQGYVVEVYRMNRRLLYLNRILSFIEDILY